MQCQLQAQAHAKTRASHPKWPLALLSTPPPGHLDSGFPAKGTNPSCLPVFYWSRKKANWTGGGIFKLSTSISATVIQDICKQGTVCVLGRDCQREGLCTV